jgi:hypothetical protein
MSTDKTELVRKIKAVMDETRLTRKWRALSKALNDRGIPSLRSGPWDEKNGSKLGNFWTSNKHLLDDELIAPERVPQGSIRSYTPECETVAHAVTQESAEAMSRTPRQGSTQSHTAVLQPEEQAACATVPHAVTQITTDKAIERFTPQFIEDLEKMVTEWRAQQTAIEVPEEQRPKFKRGKDTSTRTVRLGDQLIKDAEKYARNYRTETGGTFSGLVEVLLWEKLGRSLKYLSAETWSRGITTAEDQGQE